MPSVFSVEGVCSKNNYATGLDWGKTLSVSIQLYLHQNIYFLKMLVWLFPGIKDKVFHQGKRAQFFDRSSEALANNSSGATLRADRPCSWW